MLDRERRSSEEGGERMPVGVSTDSGSEAGDVSSSRSSSSLPLLSARGGGAVLDRWTMGGFSVVGEEVRDVGSE
jgi:hypothetical protein